ncbi:MAG: hypothetical protein PWQ43_748 [Rikenellaceae bacterium]|nr:hypothetical protein [Rikenellaceae bacterium]
MNELKKLEATLKEVLDSDKLESALWYLNDYKRLDQLEKDIKALIDKYETEVL